MALKKPIANLISHNLLILATIVGKEIINILIMTATFYYI